MQDLSEREKRELEKALNKTQGQYLSRYADVLPWCDAILWVSAARNTAVALEQICLDSLRSFSSKMVFGLSQVDLVEPMNWPKSLPFPSKEQAENIAEIAQDRAERFSSVLGRNVQVIPYSSTRGYELETLFRSLIDTCSLGRGWLFHGLKKFSYRDFLPKGLPEHIVNPSSRPKAPGFSIKDILQKKFRSEGEHNGGRI